MKRLIPPVLTLITLIAIVHPASADVLDLDIGDPARKEKHVSLVLDGIVDTRDGSVLTPDELAARLAGVRLLIVGESHTNIDAHRAQLRVIRALREAGRDVSIGLEMFPYTRQAHLDRWSAGQLEEDQFLEQADWFEHWGMHWGYYRDIFLYARDAGIPMYGINTPREVVRAVRQKGFDELSEEEAQHLPPSIDCDSADHLRLFKAYFEDDSGFHASMSDEQWQSMLDAQCTWDATMAYNAVRAMGETPAPKEILVVLIGSGHVAYGLGIERQATPWFEGKSASVVPHPMRDADCKRYDRIRASYADFIWGLPPFEHEIFPSLGVSTTEDDESGRRRVIHVGEGSVGERAGFALGDVVLAVDGADVPDRRSLNRELSRRDWGDRMLVTVNRDGKEVPLSVEFRREPISCDE